MLHSKYHYVNVIEENDNILQLVLYLYVLLIKVRFLIIKKKSKLNYIEMTFKYSNVKIDDITAKLFNKHLLISYEKQNLMVQSEWMTLTHGGVPKSDKYHTTEESRRYMQIPLNDDDFKNFINNLDIYFGSDSFKNSYLNEQQNKLNIFQ